ncbi:MFS transporter (plasmid) [Rhizobium sp. CB3090]|uniref:MFS transporter n=1 Tax=Rhizobium sp. CB3090 TaxID=3039156 RepID=UPI0024B07F0D|nr:MFS transporter [Rhizobium sp. CB3090]WFU12199.1 MFS transporter [Rhizobium sp. CB3090]
MAHNSAVATSTQRLSWYGELTPSGKRTFWACFLGYALDAFDVQIYSLAIPAIVASLSLTNTDVGVIATVTLLASAFGGWFAGILADRFGRVRTLQVTVVWFAFFTFLSGFAQNFEQLLVCRALMGLGFGGEWSAGAVLMAEVIATRHRGKAVGMVQSAWSVGWGVAVLLSTVFFSLLSQDEAWRMLFWAGIAPAIVAIIVRRFVHEPEVYVASRTQIAASGGVAKVAEIFSRPLIGRTMLLSLMTTGAQGGYYAIATWLPSFLKSEKQLSVIGSGGYLVVIILGSFFGYVVGAYLSDVIGRRRKFIVFAVGAILTVITYTYLPISNSLMLFLGFPLGFFASGIFAGMGAFLSENFATRTRAAGQGFTYNFGRGVAAMNPTLVGLATAVMPLGKAIAIFAVVAYALVILAVLALPETHGQDLPTD